MITLAKVLGSEIIKKLREIKVSQFGTKTALECSPFGDDATPIKGMVAVFARSSESGESVIVGYLNKNRLAAVGEKRIYSVNSSGEEMVAIHLKNDGTCEIGSGANSAVKFEALEASISALDTAINAELTKIAAGLAGVGGTYAVTPISTNISAAKSDFVKIK